MEESVEKIQVARICLCYLCYKLTKKFQRNFLEITSKYSKTPIKEFIQKFLNGFESERNLDNARNAICYECLEEIHEYDFSCMKATHQEIKLRELLLATETRLKSGVNVEIKKEQQVEQTETIFIKEEEHLTDESLTTVKIEPIDIEDDQPPQQQQQQVLDEQIKPNVPIVGKVPNFGSELESKPFFLKKDGKLVRVKLVNVTKILANKTPSKKPTKVTQSNPKTLVSVDIPSMAVKRFQTLKPMKTLNQPRFSIPPQRRPNQAIPSQPLIKLPSAAPKIAEQIQSHGNRNFSPTVSSPIVSSVATIPSNTLAPIRRSAPPRPRRECELCKNGKLYKTREYEVIDANS